MIKPLRNMILVKQKVQDESETSKSGIIIATSSEKKKFPMGTVVDVGSKVEEIKKGDMVLFEGWNGEPVDEELGGDTNLLLIGAERIIATYYE